MSLRRLLRQPLTAFALLIPAGPSFAAEIPIDFNRDVRPILSEHCLNCHGQDGKNNKGGLHLDTREGALKGGESGEPALVPGDPEKSDLIARIASHDKDEVMPPPKFKKPVSAEDLEKLKRWVATGAEYAGHWAFTAPKRPVVPDNVPGTANAIDAFVRTRLLSVNLPPSPSASVEALCRRLHLDLIGLPPSPATVAEFSTAYAANPTTAWSTLIDALLGSPHFGEKWARHWMDVARYADSDGYEKDLPRQQWAWRDWVVNAVNRDMPYDQFVIEQIAGDLLPNATQDQRVATGFLRNGMVNEEGAIIPEEFRMEGMFDRMDCVGKAVLGLTLQCAQCHTHKFDPLTHDEYHIIHQFIKRVSVLTVENKAEASLFVVIANENHGSAKIRILQKRFGY